MRAWPALCTLLGGGAAAVAAATRLGPPSPHVAAIWLAWDALGWPREPWTLWTAAWVHSSGGSLGGNLAALAALAVLGTAIGAGRTATLALLLAWPLTTLSLVLWPQVGSYTGLGGPIHAAAAVLAVHVARRTAARPLAALLFGGIALKLLAERAWIQPVAFDPSWGANIVYAAHLAGTLIGAACALILDGVMEPVAAVSHDAAGEPPAPRA